MVNIAGGQVYAHCVGTLAHVSMTWAYPRIVHWSRAQRWITVFAIFVAVTAIGCAIANVIFVLAGLYQARNFWEPLSMGIPDRTDHHDRVRNQWGHYRNAEVEDSNRQTPTMNEH